MKNAYAFILSVTSTVQDILLHKKLSWYVNRLAAMSAPEILHRVMEMAKRAHDKRRGHILAPEGRDLGPLPAIPGLREGLEQWDVPPALLAEWEEHAQQMRSGRFFLLGQEWPESAPEKKWRLDPVTGKHWPHDRYCFSIDFRHAHEMGDVKYVWELARLQYLQPVAALVFKRKDAALAKLCLDEIENWIDHNPPHLGVHWASGIELAFRVVSILVVTSLTGEYLSPSARAKIWGTLAAHASWLERYPSKYSSANNHRAAEGLGLFIIGALCQQLEHAARWKAHGWEILCETAQLQILPDGVGAEQAITYTAVVLEMLLLGHHVARAGQASIPEYYMERVTLGGEYLRWFTDAGGEQPRIGDDDNARVLASRPQFRGQKDTSHLNECHVYPGNNEDYFRDMTLGVYRRDEHYARAVLAAIASSTNRPDLTPPRHEPHLRQALFGFPPAAAPGPSGVRIFADGGYTVGRHNIDGREIMLAMDHGPLGYLAIAAHGHADALALWLHIGDQPVLVDSGTYLYHSGGKWRDYFRGTQAHNTLLLVSRPRNDLNEFRGRKDTSLMNACHVHPGNNESYFRDMTRERADSSVISGNFNWSRKARARLTGSSVTPERWRIEAEHDGYAKEFGAIHRRRLTVTPATGFTVEDWLVSGKSHFVEIGFLLHPALDAAQNGGEIAICRGGETMLRLRHEGKLAAAIHLPGAPDCGWYSPSFGEKQPAARIVFSGALAPEEKAITHFSFV